MPGSADDAAAVCSAASVQSVSPPPTLSGGRPAQARAYVRAGWPTGSGMAGLGGELRNQLRTDEGT